ETVTPTAGRVAPRDNASSVLTAPATNPLVPAMKTASDADTLRVRLLSIAQHRQAAAIINGPNHSMACAFPSGHDSTTPPATISSMPATMRRSAFSRNTSHAITAVNTASRLSKGEAAEALV